MTATEAAAPAVAAAIAMRAKRRESAPSSWIHDSRVGGVGQVTTARRVGVIGHVVERSRTTYRRARPLGGNHAGLAHETSGRTSSPE